MPSLTKRGFDLFLNFRESESGFLKQAFIASESLEEIISCSKRLIPLGGQLALQKKFGKVLVF